MNGAPGVDGVIDRGPAERSLIAVVVGRIPGRHARGGLDPPFASY
jgi:hypothetical protein